MQFFSFSQATWLLLVCTGGARIASAETSSSGVAEVDLVFPRNQTFAPTTRLPVVFAYQNSELASALNTYITFSVWDADKEDLPVLSAQRDMTWANFSSRDPYLDHEYHTGFNTEGHWFLKWTVAWTSCTEESLGVGYPRDERITVNRTTGGVYFTTSNSAPELDLVAATDNKDCSDELGVAISVDHTLKVPSWVQWSGMHSGKECAVVASATPTPEPCRVKLDAAVTSSMAASLTARACAWQAVSNATDIDCPPKDEKSAAHQLAVGGVACLAAAIGASGYLMIAMMM